MPPGQILKNVSRGSFFLAAEQLAGLVAGILYSIIVVRWLGPTSYGMLSLGLALIGLATMGTGNFELYLERFSAEYETRGRMAELRRAHFLALGLKVGLGVLVCGVVLALSSWLGQHYGSSVLTRVLWILSAMAILEGFTVTGRAVLFGLQRFGWIAALSVLAHVLKIALVVFLWLRGEGLYFLTAALVLVGGLQAAALTVVAAWLIRRGRAAVADPVSEEMIAVAEQEEAAAAFAAGPPPAERSLVSRIFRYSLPLFGARAAYVAGQNLSRVVLGNFLSLEMLGYFSFAQTVVDRFVSFVYALPFSLLPSLTHLVARREKARFLRLFDKAFRLVTTAAATLAVGLFLFAGELTRIVGGKAYLPAVPALSVLALVLWVRTAHEPVTMAFYSLRLPGRVLGVALAKLACEIAGFVVLIPLFGMIGAAWASFVGAALALAAALTLLGRELPPSGHRWMVLGKTAVVVGLAAGLGLGVHAWAGAPWAEIAIKALLLLPAFAVAVFVCDLVTEDDLRRAAEMEIHAPWARRARDRVVAVSLKLSRAVSPLRPPAMATAEGD